jgi:hypothetical protein
LSNPEIKRFRFYRKLKSVAYLGHPVLLRRASAVVTDVGRVAVDADVTKTNVAERTAKACGPDVAVLTSMHLEATASQGATEAKEPFSGESTL